MQLKPIFIRKEVLALAFSWQLSAIFSNNFFKEKKKYCYKKKEHCYKKQISIANQMLITQLFITSPRFLYSSTVYSDNGLYSFTSRKKNIESSK